MIRFTGWTTIGIILAVLVGTIHALALWGEAIWHRCVDEDPGPLGPRFQYATTEPDNVDPLGYT